MGGVGRAKDLSAPLYNILVVKTPAVQIFELELNSYGDYRRLSVVHYICTDESTYMLVIPNRITLTKALNSLCFYTPDN